jgi:hypothetical protein
MTDPKLDKLQGKGNDPVESKPVPESEKLREERAQRLRASSAGFSINDTIARDANLSVGSRGVDVSGVKTGTGAGGGSTITTPGVRGESPAPNIVPGARGSGTTPRSTSGLIDDTHVDLGEGTGRPTHSQVSERAYRCWHERGCPDGSPEVDWQRAERELIEEQRGGRAASAKA